MRGAMLFTPPSRSYREGPAGAGFCARFFDTAGRFSLACAPSAANAGEGTSKAAAKASATTPYRLPLFMSRLSLSVWVTSPVEHRPGPATDAQWQPGRGIPGSELTAHARRHVPRPSPLLRLSLITGGASD